MTATQRKIFANGSVTLVGEVLVRMISNGAKKQKFVAEVTNESSEEPFIVADESANEKLFADAGAAVKYIAPYCEAAQLITVEVDTDDYLTVAAAGDPTKTLDREITKVEKEIARLVPIVAKLTTSIAAALALNWNTGSAAQRAKYEDDTMRKILVEGLQFSLNARLQTLQAQVAP